MAGVNDGFRRQFGNNRGKAAEQLLPGTAGEVSSSHTHAEKRVTRESHMFFLAIENDAAWRMAWGVEHLQLMIAKRNNIVVAQDSAYRSTGKVWPKVETHHAALLVKVFYHHLVGCVGLGLQSKGRENEGCTKYMVEMAVCAEVVNGFQAVVVNISLDGLLLGIVKGTTVYDDTLKGFIAHHIAILLNRIHFEGLDLHDIFFLLPFSDWYIDAVFLLEPLLAEIAGELGSLSNLFVRLDFALKIAAF